VRAKVVAGSGTMAYGLAASHTLPSDEPTSAGHRGSKGGASTIHSIRVELLPTVWMNDGEHSPSLDRRCCAQNIFLLSPSSDNLDPHR
jgi:hypothetical protein